MTEEDEKGFKTNSICRYCEEKTSPNKVKNQCHLTCKNRRPAPQKFKFIVTQKRSILTASLFHFVSNRLVIFSSKR